MKRKDKEFDTIDSILGPEPETPEFEVKVSQTLTYMITAKTPEEAVMQVFREGPSPDDRQMRVFVSMIQEEEEDEED